MEHRTHVFVGAGIWAVVAQEADEVVCGFGLLEGFGLLLHLLFEVCATSLICPSFDVGA